MFSPFASASSSYGKEQPAGAADEGVGCGDKPGLALLALEVVLQTERVPLSKGTALKAPRQSTRTTWASLRTQQVAVPAMSYLDFVVIALVSGRSSCGCEVGAELW